MAGLTEITIDMSLLQNTVTTMQEQVARLRGDMDDIFNQIQELDRMWDGPANDTFRAQFLQDRQEMQEICNELQKMNDCLVYAKNEYNTCENNINGIVTSIRI